MATTVIFKYPRNLNKITLTLLDALAGISFESSLTVEFSFLIWFSLLTDTVVGSIHSILIFDFY